jgi:hypothetical protein
VKNKECGQSDEEETGNMSGKISQQNVMRCKVVNSRLNIVEIKTSKKSDVIQVSAEAKR